MSALANIQTRTAVLLTTSQFFENNSLKRMSLILHLSDLHLGTNDPPLDDAKSETIPKSERESRQKTIRRTLRKFRRYLNNSGDSLAAVFVTGDISYGYDETGFQQFEDVLGELGDQLPAKSRIAVLPGNHDVSHGTAPSCRARYEFFNKYVRKQRFVTPLLDGIDIAVGRIPSGDLKRHFIIDTENRWLVVPVNTANYCQMIEPIGPIPEGKWSEFGKSLSAFGQEKVASTLRNLRLNDVVRISPEQFDALEELLHKAKEAITAHGDDPASYLLIALLHHHLLPVSTLEEIKKFESFTNLGLLRHFLAKHRFNLVVHGHKHIAKQYWDFVPFASANDLIPHQLLVISGGTIGETYHAEDEVGRLLRITPDQNARTLNLAPVRGLVAGDNFGDLTFQTVPLWEADLRHDAEGAPFQRIHGKDVDAVYERILAVFRQPCPEEQRYNFVCQIADGSTAAIIPKGYPEVDAASPDGKQQWFKNLVDWWQLDKPTLSKTLHFTHGDRIYRDTDQIQNVVALLNARAHSSRAVVTLCRPQIDVIHEHRNKFPSFCLVQFVIREKCGKPVLDCIGYFRKQEMKYWWPVNVAELAELQKRVFGGIAKSNGSEHLQLGSITTFASIAKIGSRPPQVTVPIVDRNLDQDPKLLWNMCYALFWTDIPDRKKYLQEWDNVFKELVPEGVFDADGVPVPLGGLSYLLEHVERFSVHHPGANVKKLVTAMRDLKDRNEEFAEALYENEERARTKYQQWQQRAAELVEEMRTVVRKIFRA